MKKRKLIICLVFIMFLFLTSCKIICEIQGHNYMFISNNNGSHNLICTYDATHMEVENCDFSEWEVVKEAKPFEEGKEERICSKCNYKEERIIPATHQHEYSDEWIVDKEATCTEKGLKSHHCINEGCTSKIEETEIDVKEHDYGEWEVVVEVKCETNGFEQRKCKDCSFTDTRVVNKLGHDEIKYEMLAPTCTETGYNEYVICSRCDYTTYIELAALGHDEIKHEEKAATCTEYGYESYVTCTRCDYTTYVEIAAFGHNYSDEWTVDIEPSEENVGSKAKYCINERCLEKKDVTEIPKLPYSDGLLYELNSMKNGYIVKGIGEFDGTKLYITPVYNNLPVVEIAVGSFKNCTSLVNIAIPNSVESIGYKAFEGCSSLTSISIPFVGEKQTEANQLILDLYLDLILFPKH